MIAPACNWTVDQAGRTICATRRDLYSAVVQATRLPSGEKRTTAVLAAMEAHAAHSCTPIGFVPGDGAHVVAGSRHRANGEAETPGPSHMQARPVEGASGCGDIPRTEVTGTSAGPKCICGGFSGFSQVDGALARLCPVHGEPPRRSSDSDGPPTLLSLHRHVLELSGAALVLGMRIERQAHPDAPADTGEKIREAEKRMEAASEVLLRALEKYTTPQLLRHPHASV